MFDHARKVGAHGLLAAVVAAGAALASLPAAAQHHGGFHGGYHGGYHGGGWHHHGGWGWGVGIGIYDPWWPGYYPGYYPYYAEPPVTVIEQAPVVQAPAPVVQAAPTYYYCDNPAGYYPYVQQCTQPWRPVAAQPAPNR